MFTFRQAAAVPVEAGVSSAPWNRLQPCQGAAAMVDLMKSKANGNLSVPSKRGDIENKLKADVKGSKPVEGVKDRKIEKAASLGKKKVEDGMKSKKVIVDKMKEKELRSNLLPDKGRGKKIEGPEKTSSNSITSAKDKMGDSARGKMGAFRLMDSSPSPVRLSLNRKKNVPESSSSDDIRASAFVNRRKKNCGDGSMKSETAALFDETETEQLYYLLVRSDFLNSTNNHHLYAIFEAIGEYKGREGQDKDGCWYEIVFDSFINMRMWKERLSFLSFGKSILKAPLVVVERRVSMSGRQPVPKPEYAKRGVRGRGRGTGVSGTRPGTGGRGRSSNAV